MERRTIRMPSGRVTRAAAVTLAGLVTVPAVLAGCQSEGTPSATTSPSASLTSASPSASTSSPAPSASASVDIPAAARVKSDKGAEAFVRYYFEQINAAWMRPEPGLIANLSDPKCEFCSQVEKTSVQLAKDGQRYRENPVSLGKLSGQTDAPANQVIFAGVITQHPASVVDSSGRVVSTDQAGRGKSRIGLKWTSSGWRMVGVEVA
ncbi:MAG TPA: DUF6318 family protein [Ornithinibacter sp.]|nr:DUF6318 family protein [Ornithinibacter sp.]